MSVIKTPYIERIEPRRVGLRRLLRHRKAKHWMRTYYALKSIISSKASLKGMNYKDYWQAGKVWTGFIKSSLQARCPAFLGRRTRRRALLNHLQRKLGDHPKMDGEVPDDCEVEDLMVAEVFAFLPGQAARRRRRRYPE